MKGNFRIYCESEEFPAADVRALEEALDGLAASDVPLSAEFVFTDESEIRRLNRELRGTDKTTDVLSFPSLDKIKGKPLKKADYAADVDDEGNLFIGSVAVCAGRAREQAREYGHSYHRELHYLLVHGVLHCLGYDHMTDGERAEMREREESVLQKLGLTRDE